MYTSQHLLVYLLCYMLEYPVPKVIIRLTDLLLFCHCLCYFH